jgi:hypothetical protein
MRQLDPVAAAAGPLQARSQAWRACRAASKGRPRSGGRLGSPEPFLWHERSDGPPPRRYGTKRSITSESCDCARNPTPTVTRLTWWGTPLLASLWRDSLDRPARRSIAAPGASLSSGRQSRARGPTGSTPTAGACPRRAEGGQRGAGAERGGGGRPARGRARVTPASRHAPAPSQTVWPRAGFLRRVTDRRGMAARSGRDA